MINVGCLEYHWEFYTVGGRERMGEVIVSTMGEDRHYCGGVISSTVGDIISADREVQSPHLFHVHFHWEIS